MTGTTAYVIGIEWRDAVQQRRHQARQARRRAQSYRDADARQCQAVAHEHSFQLALLRAERRANADLAPSLRDRVGDHAVDADDAQQQRHRRGDRQHHQREGRPRERLIVDLAHGPRRHGQAGVHRPHGLPDLVQKTFRARALAADDEGHPADGIRPPCRSRFRYADIEGQYTVAGAGWYRPFSRTSCTTPMTSCHGMLGILAEPFANARLLVCPRAHGQDSRKS